MCYSRGPKADYECEVCEVWPWASGRARQFLKEGQVRHIMYEYRWLGWMVKKALSMGKVVTII